MSRITVTPPRNHLFPDPQALGAAASSAGWVPGLPGWLRPASLALDAGRGQFRAEELCAGSRGHREQERKVLGTHTVPAPPGSQHRALWVTRTRRGHRGPWGSGGGSEGKEAGGWESSREAHSGPEERVGLGGERRDAEVGEGRWHKGVPVGPAAVTEQEGNGPQPKVTLAPQSPPSSACLATSPLLPASPRDQARSPGPRLPLHHGRRL